VFGLVSAQGLGEPWKEPLAGPYPEGLGLSPAKRQVSSRWPRYRPMGPSGRNEHFHAREYCSAMNHWIPKVFGTTNSEPIAFGFVFGWAKKSNGSSSLLARSARDDRSVHSLIVGSAMTLSLGLCDAANLASLQENRPFHRKGGVGILSSTSPRVLIVVMADHGLMKVR